MVRVLSRSQRRLRLGQSRRIQLGRQLHDRQSERLADRRDRRLQLQTGTWVWGLEGDIDYALIKGNATNTATCGAGSCEVKNTWFGTARGRIGYAGWNNFLPYITGGGAFAGLKVEPSGGTSSTDTTIGWTAGAGLEYAFMSNWSAKIEYLYADLGTATCEAAVCGVDTDISPKINIVRGGINYRF